MIAYRFDRISSNPAKMNGQACIRGMRLTVRRVLEAMATHGGNIEQVRKEYPELEIEDINQAIEFAAAILDDEIVNLPQQL